MDPTGFDNSFKKWITRILFLIFIVIYLVDFTSTWDQQMLHERPTKNTYESASPTSWLHINHIVFKLFYNENK